MDKQVYTISQAAKEVGESASVLRYWEQTLEIRVNRDSKGYRCYTGYDIQLFLNIKELKKRGLKLDAIRELVPRIYQYGPGAPRSKTRLLEDSGQEWDVECEQAEEIFEIEEANDIEEIRDFEELRKTEEAQDVEELREPDGLRDAEEAQDTEEIQQADEPQESGAQAPDGVQEPPIAQESQEPPLSKARREEEPSQIPEEGQVPLRMNPKDDLRLTEFQNILEKLIAQGVKEKNQEELRIRKLDEKIRYHQQGIKQVAAAQEIKRRRRGKRRKK